MAKKLSLAPKVDATTMTAMQELASDSDEMNKKEAEWKAKRKAAQDARDVL